jgi:hypothetical protein
MTRCAAVPGSMTRCAAQWTVIQPLPAQCVYAVTVTFKYQEKSTIAKGSSFLKPYLNEKVTLLSETI